MYDEAEICRESQLHPDLIARVNAAMPRDEELFDLTELFRTFGDTTRIKILYILRESELCVCDIAEVVGMSQSAVSHQLKALKTARLVRFRKDGKSVFYSLDDEHVHSIIEQGINHIQENRR